MDCGGEADSRVRTAFYATHKEFRQVLTEALRTLPEPHAHVVALRDIHGLDTSEVAELLGLSTGNVRVILHRARAVLRERLAD